MKASKRSLLSIGLVTVLVASFGMISAGAQGADPTVANVDVRTVLAGTANKEFKISVFHRAGLPVNALIIAVPPGDYVAIEGRSPGWNSLRLSEENILFTGGSIAPGTSAVFSIFTNVPVVPLDTTGAWLVRASSDGGQTSKRLPPGSNDPRSGFAGSLDTTIRVLTVAGFAITAPAGAKDNMVTGRQGNIKAVCQVQNVGSMGLNVTSNVESDDGLFTPTQAPAAMIPPGGTASYTIGMTTDDVEFVESDEAECTASNPAGTAVSIDSRSFELDIQPRAILEYEDDTLSPELVAPGANPTFSINVIKRQNGTPFPVIEDDASPAVRLDQTQTNFSFATFGPTGLAAATTLPAGRVGDVLDENGAFLKFAAATVPQLADAEYGVTINVVGTDENGAGVSFRPLPNVDDLVRVDAAIPVVAPSLDPPASRCCNAKEAVRNGDSLGIEGTVTDRDPESGDQVACEDCTVTKAELVLFANEDGSGGAVGRIDITDQVENDDGELSGEYDGNYPGAKSVLVGVVVRDEAGNLSNEGNLSFSELIEVDNIAPTIARAIATPAPTVASQDLQRQLRVEFTEEVDNFNQPVDGVCPGPDWRVDDNTVLSCARDNNFLSAGLLVADQLPDDGPGLGSLGYFPFGLVTFHDRVGNPIETGTTVNIIDRIPPKAPDIDTVGGQETGGVDEDDDDPRFYTTSSSPTFSLSGARAVKAGYTIQLFKETNLCEGFQPSAEEGCGNGLADSKIGQSVAQGDEVNVVGNLGPGDPGAPAGEEHVVYARSLDTASPANPTPVNLIDPVTVVLDIVRPKLSAATPPRPQADRIVVTFTEAVNGVNFAFHWHVEDNADRDLNVGEVEGDGNIRDVKMDDPAYLANKVGSIEWQFVGTASDRYHDKAGWTLQDFIYNFS